MLSAKNGSQQLKRALATWAYPQSSNIGLEDTIGTNNLTSYTDDPFLLTFARHFCRNIILHDQLDLRCRIWGGGSRSPIGSLPSPIGQWCARVLHDCVANDKSAVLPVYIQLHHAALTLNSTQYRIHAWSICVAIEYLSRAPGSSYDAPDQRPLVSQDFVYCVRVQVERVLVSYEKELLDF